MGQAQGVFCHSALSFESIDGLLDMPSSLACGIAVMTALLGTGGRRGQSRDGESPTGEGQLWVGAYTADTPLFLPDCLE